MGKCIPLFIPSNLGETELNIGIAPRLGDNMQNPVELRPIYRRNGKEHRFEGYNSFIWVNSAQEAQREVIRLSRQLEKHPTGSIQSDRLYFMPLIAEVGYSITVAPKKRHERPVIRVTHHPQDLARTWHCEIYASNLIQLQEALFSHERNLLKKRLQVLNRQRDSASPM